MKNKKIILALFYVWTNKTAEFSTSAIGYYKCSHTKNSPNMNSRKKNNKIMYLISLVRIVGFQPAVLPKTVFERIVLNMI